MYLLFSLHPSLITSVVCISCCHNPWNEAPEGNQFILYSAPKNPQVGRKILTEKEKALLPCHPENISLWGKEVQAH